MRITHLAVSNDLTSSVYFLQKRLKSELKNTQNCLYDDKQEEMKESKAVYVNKRKIREDHELVYRLNQSERYGPTLQSSDNKHNSHFSCQYDSKVDNEICTCKNVITVRKHQEIKYYSGLPKQIYAFHGARSITDVGVGSVKALPKKNVKRIYLPETDNKGVGSSDLFSTISRRSRHPKEVANGSCYYDYKRTSSKCVGGIFEYNTGCVVNQKLSPIVQTKSRSTSPELSYELKSTEIGSNIVYKKFETIGTQCAKKEPEKVEAKTAEPFEVETKPVKKLSEQTQKCKYSNEATDDKKKSEVGKRAKDVYKNSSSDSLVQHIHDLEIPSDDKNSSSFPDPMENKLEREYRKMFSTTKSKDSKPNVQTPLPEFKSVSLLKRRFDALRRGMHKKDSNTKKLDSIMISTGTRDSFPAHKDASVSSDPPSLISRSISDSNKYSPVNGSAEQDRNKNDFCKNNSEQWPRNVTHSEIQGVKGMFKLWGKKFNFEDETHSGRKTTPMPSYNKVKTPKKVMKPNIEVQTKKENKKFSFFKKKSKDNPSQPYKSKKNVTAGRCEIGDVLTLKLEGDTHRGKVSTIPEEAIEITRKTWMKKFLSNTIESARSVKIRWNNSMYATSSSTILELLDTVYTNAGLVFKSRSEITTEESSFYKSFTKPKVNFVRDIEAWMIPKTIPDRPMKQLPVKMNSNKQNKDKNIELSISDQKWFIDRSKAFLNNIEVVINSDNSNMFNNTKYSSEYLKINIPKDFFDSTSSTETKRPPEPVIQRNQFSDEEVYKIVEYETNSEIGRGGAATKKFENGDFAAHDIEVIVSFQDSKNLESKNLKIPMYRDVVIQGSNVNIPKRCDVVGVGIITRRDLRDTRKPILQIQGIEDETDEESDTLMWPTQKKCGFAERYLQDYYRHLTPLGIDLYSWCVSDCQLRTSSERSIVSYYHLGDGSMSCPNISDDFQAANIRSSGELSPTYNNYEDLWAEPDNCGKKILKIFKKNALEVNRETDRNDKRVHPKDSVEVFKRRKIYATSNKARWIGSAAAQDKTVGVPSIDSIGAQKTTLKKYIKNIITSTNKAIKKHVSMKQLSDNSPEGILQFKDAGCEVCVNKHSKHSEYVNVNSLPSCEIHQSRCKASCENMKKASCSRPNSPPDKIPRQPRDSCDPGLQSHRSQSQSKWPVGSASHNSSRVPSQTSLSSSNIPSCSRSGSKYLGYIPVLAKNPPPGLTPRRSTSPAKSPSASPRIVSQDTKTLIYPCTSNPSTPTPSCPPTEESNATALCRMCSDPASIVRKINSLKSQINEKSHPTTSGSISSSCCKSKTGSNPRSSNVSSMYECCKNPTSEDCKKCCQYPMGTISRLPQKKKKCSSPPYSHQQTPLTRHGSPTTDQLKKMSSPHSSQRSPCQLPTYDQLHKNSSSPHSPQRSPSHSSTCDQLKKNTTSPRRPQKGPEITPCCSLSCGRFKKKPSPPHTQESSPVKKTCGSFPCNKLKKSTPPRSAPKPPKQPKMSFCSSPPCNQLNNKSSPSHSPQRARCGSPLCDQLNEMPCPRSPQRPTRRSPPHDQLKNKSSPPYSPQRSSCCPPPGDQLRKESSSPRSSQISPYGDPLRKKASPPHSPQRSPINSPPSDQLKKNSSCSCSSLSSLCRPLRHDHLKKKSPCPRCSPRRSPSRDQLKNMSQSPHSPQRTSCGPTPCKQLIKETSPPQSPQRPPPCNQLENESSTPHTSQRSPHSLSSDQNKDSSPHRSSQRPCCQLPYYDKAVSQDSSCPMNNQTLTPPSQKNTNTSPPAEPIKKPNKCLKKCSMKSKKQPMSQTKHSSPYPLTPDLQKPSGIHLKIIKSKICADDCSAWGSEQLQEVVRLNSSEQITISLEEQTPKVQDIRKPICQKLQDEDGKTVYERKDYTCGKAWDSPDPLQSLLRLNSREEITIRLKEHTPSVQEIRKPICRKMIDEDGKTLYERKDYTYENVLTDMYRDSKINRVSTPVTTKVSESKDHNESSAAALSEQSLDNLIEIQFKFRVAQGDKTQIKIENESEEKKPEKTEDWEEKPEICFVNNATEEINGEINPKNDIDIKIIVRNYKPKHRNIKYKSDHTEFSKKISDKFHSVSTGYSNLNTVPSTDNVFSVHRATVNLSSSAEQSKTHGKISKEAPSKDLIETQSNVTVSSHNTEQFPSKEIQSKHLIDNDPNFTVSSHCTEQLPCKEVPSKDFTQNEPNFTVSSHSTEQLPTDVTEDEITEEKSISSKKDSQSEKLEETNTNVSELPDFNDTDDQDTAVTHTSDEYNVSSIISKHTSKEMKKLFLKKVMQKANRTQGKNKNTVQQLKDMLKIILTDSSDNDDWNVTSNSFRNTDSMNNYYRQDSPVLSTQDKIEAIYPTLEDNSIASNSSDSGASYFTFKGCMCSQAAEKLNQNNIRCCCRQKNNKDGETICDIKNEYVSVEVQNSKSLTPKVNSLNVSVHSKSFAKTGNIKFAEETEIINSPMVKRRKIKSQSTRKKKENKVKRLNQDTLLGISDDDKVIVLCEKSTKHSRELSNEQDVFINERKKIDDCLKNTEILQSYEAKKAVLEIYAEKAEDGKNLVAKLPRFIAEKESEIARNYEQIVSNSYKSICKENIVMSVRR